MTGDKIQNRRRPRRRYRVVRRRWFNPFPDPRTASPEGVVAVGGNFWPQTLLAAYSRGIFPWPSEDISLIWFSPDPRMILPPSEVHISRSLRRTLNRGDLRVSFDQAFEQVIDACSREQGRGESGTWIEPELRQGFCELHRWGFAHSVEVWRGDTLVGGLYGLSLGAMFCGESMFHTENDASKVAFVALAQKLAAWDYLFLDCQVHSPHLAALGAREIPREEFLRLLDEALQRPTRLGPWSG